MREKDRQPDRAPKRTGNRGAKGPTIETTKVPTNYIPVRVFGVMGEKELKALLLRSSQWRWATPKRIAGLLLLMSFALKKGRKSFSISSELAHEYVGRLKGSTETVSQPLALLVHVGILEMVRPAKIGPHCKVAAEHRFHPDYRSVSELTIWVTAGQHSKYTDAANRNERRLNRKHRFRARLVADMEQLTMSLEGQAQAAGLMIGDKKEATRLTLESLNGSRPRTVSVDKVGTIRTFINSIPRELKPHLKIDGKPAVKRDIDGAHFCALLRIASDRIEHLRNRYPTSSEIPALTAEREKLRAMIAEGDIYRQGMEMATPEVRKTNKKEMLSGLNMQSSIAIRLPAFRWFIGEFPLIGSVIRDIKRKDHRNLSLQLQNYTARVINGALLELQSMGIPAFPDTDALIVPARHGGKVEEVIERWLAEIFGGGKVSDH